MKYTFLLLNIVASSLAWTFNGTCPSFENCYGSNLSFLGEDFMGIWFLYASIPLPFQDATKCVYTYDTLTDKPNQFNATIYEINAVTNQSRHSSGVFTLIPPNDAGMRYTELQFPLPTRLLEVTKDFYLLASCLECGFYTREGAGIYGHILTRLKFPSEEVIDQAFKAFEKCGVSRDAFAVQDHTNCDIWY